MEKSDKKDKILLVRHLGRITSWLKSYVDCFFRRATEATAAMRATDEAVRTAEAQRVAAEELRIYNETQRNGKEKFRESHEKTRQTAETARAEAENRRVSAEADRDAAEKERARVFATYAATISDLQKRLTALEGKRSIILED